jgi:simple sugar transport system permease protein
MAGGVDVEVLAGIVAAATPLVYATIGETISEKAGVINLSLDGSIMLSAMTGFAAAYVSGSVVVGFLAAMAVSAAIAALVAFSSIELRLNQIAVGFVLFLLARQLALFLGDSYVGVNGPKVPAWDVPLLADIPVIGTVFFQHNVSVYGSYLVIFFAFWFLYRTRPGLVLRGVGERPEAAFARGVPVNRLRYLYTILGGALVGLAGAAVSLDQIAGWRENLTLNVGWIALAFVIFGGWHPYRVALACYLYRGLLFVAGEFQVQFPDLVQVLTQLPFLLMILMITVINTDWFKRLGDRYPRWRNFLASSAPSGSGKAFIRE